MAITTPFSVYRPSTGSWRDRQATAAPVSSSKLYGINVLPLDEIVVCLDMLACSQDTSKGNSQGITDVAQLGSYRPKGNPGRQPLVMITPGQ